MAHHHKGTDITSMFRKMASEGHNPFKHVTHVTSNGKTKAIKKKTEPFQTSKEYFRGKWQHVGFYGSRKNPTIKPIKD